MTRRRTGVTVGAVYAAVRLSQEGSSNHALDVLEREGLLAPLHLPVELRATHHGAHAPLYRAAARVSTVRASGAGPRMSSRSIVRMAAPTASAIAARSRVRRSTSARSLISSLSRSSRPRRG